MEPYIADLINNSKIPKSIRILIILILCSFVIFLGIILGNVFGFLLALAFLVILIYLGIKIINKVILKMVFLNIKIII